MIPQTLIRYIETEIIPRYEHFDKAHNLSHVQTVIDESLALAKLYPQADERLVYTIAAYHDGTVPRPCHASPRFGRNHSGRRQPSAMVRQSRDKDYA